MKAATIALYCDGKAPKEIAAMIGATVNDVQRTLTNMRTALKLKPQPVKRRTMPAEALAFVGSTQDPWNHGAASRRQVFSRRAARAASEALRNRGEVPVAEPIFQTGESSPYFIDYSRKSSANSAIKKTAQ